MVIGFSSPLTRTKGKDIDRKALANLRANLARSNKSVEHGDSAHWQPFFLYNPRLPVCVFCLNPQRSSQKTRTPLPTVVFVSPTNALPLRNAWIYRPRTDP